MAKRRSGAGDDRAFVWSSERGQLCPRCDRPIAACVCRRPGGPPNDGVVRVGRETKGRRGKGVTVITGVPLEGAELAELGKQLKRRCGSGGTLKDGVLEIQGDHRDLLVSELEARGWTVKRSGG